MTQITYNNITIQDPLTHVVDQQPIYDTAGDVDQIYVKTTVTVQFTFHTISSAGLGYNVGSDLAGGVAAALKALTTHRRRFTMSIGGTTLFDIRPGETETDVVVVGGSEFDLNNGPKPSLKIEEITGIKVARGTFTVEFATPSCGTPSDGPINLRWWTTDDVDANWYTTRTIAGRLRVASHNNSPHSFRHLMFPPLQKGFKRESMSFTEDPNGLELDFSIKDVEKYRAAPSPSTTWRGNHRMISQVPGATTVESEVSVELEGSHDVPQTTLVQLAIKIIDSKLQLEEQGVGSTGKANAMILYYAIDASLDENRVEAICRIKHTGSGKDAFEFLPQAGKVLGQPLPADIAIGVQYDPLVSRLLPGPTAPLTTIIESILQTPCNPAALPNAGDVKPTGTQSDETDDSTKITTAIGTLAPTNKGPAYADEHQESPYTTYTVRIENFTRQGRARMALATSSSSGDDTIVVSTSKPISNRTFHVIAHRFGEEPELLTPKLEFTDELDVKHTLFSDKFTVPKVVNTDGAGVQLFMRTQTLRYHLTNDPNIAQNGMTVPLAPWLKPGAQAKNVVPGFLTDPAGG